MARTILLIALLVMCFAPGLAARQKASTANKPVQPGPSDRTGVIFGPGHAFSLDAPDQWVLDNESGSAQGLQAVFYPVGKSWTNAPVVIYANVILKKNPRTENARTVAARDIADFRKKSPTLKVTDAAPLPTGDQVAGHPKRAIVKYFSGDDFGNSEAVAYIDESKVVVMLVLSSRKETNFQPALPTFAQLVRSYRFLTDKVISD
jgi:surface antigen